jgi:hypothetical protein
MFAVLVSELKERRTRSQEEGNTALEKFSVCVAGRHIQEAEDLLLDLGYTISFALRRDVGQSANFC